MSITVYSDGNVRWPRRVLPSGESRWFTWVCADRRGIQAGGRTNGRTPDRYITLTARRVIKERRLILRLAVWSCMLGRDYARCSIGRCTENCPGRLAGVTRTDTSAGRRRVMKVKDQSPTVVVVEMKSNDEARSRSSQRQPRAAQTRPSMHYDGKPSHSTAIVFCLEIPLL